MMTNQLKFMGLHHIFHLKIFKGRGNTKELDVYSVEMLMCEIFSGHPPFDDWTHDSDSILKMYERLRSLLISPGIPKGYAEIMEKCWNSDPIKRSTIRELPNFAKERLLKV